MSLFSCKFWLQQSLQYAAVSLENEGKTMSTEMNEVDKQVIPKEECLDQLVLKSSHKTKKMCAEKRYKELLTKSNLILQRVEQLAN